MADLSRLQRERNEWVAKNFPGDKIEDSVFGAMEELGELCHHLLKMKQGIRGDDEFHREKIRDSIADIVIFLAGPCSHFGWDYGEIVEEVWEEVKKRDWVKHREENGTELKEHWNAKS